MLRMSCRKRYGCSDIDYRSRECIANFEISKLLDDKLSDQDIKELQEAEMLAKRFLDWHIDEETQDIMELLKDMLDDLNTGGSFLQQDEYQDHLEDSEDSKRFQEIREEGINLEQDLPDDFEGENNSRADGR